jgi:hypothetical protein
LAAPEGSVKSVSVTIVVGEAWNTQTSSLPMSHTCQSPPSRLHVVLGQELAG